MKFLPCYRDLLGCQNEDEVFQYLIGNLKDTITEWNYFVNWAKVNQGVDKVRSQLALLQTLVGKADIEAEALALLRAHPEVTSMIPVLLACRDDALQLLKEYKNGAFLYENYDFRKKAALPPEKAVEFMSSTGFLEHLRTGRITSLVDYVMGVEVGLDSNGRKNRSGTAMEEVVGYFIDKVCTAAGYEYMAQATAPKVQAKWGKQIAVARSSRKIDFAIRTPNQLVLIETNFYGGGGSKLKSTAGEYKTDFRRWSAEGHRFVWITDGAGWRSTHLPLRETFDETDYILNLAMVEKGLLEQILL